MKIQTIGYTGRKPAEIAAIVRESDGLLLDIRYSAKSRNPAWNKRQLEEMLSGKYCHLWEWGNVNYKGGEIDIADYDYGLTMLQAIIKDAEAAGNLSGNEIILLMCACKDADHCHRTEVARLLRADGYEVSEWPK